jgi:L-2-hydroxyglutarate oxidase LhgO
MQELTSYLEDKVIFKKQKISNFSEIKTNFIVNCSGMGAIKLNNEEKLVSVQGHLIMLKDQNPKSIDHMIFLYLDETIKNIINGQKELFTFHRKDCQTLHLMILV